MALPFEWSGEAAPHLFNADEANALVGKTILISVTYVGPKGEEGECFQMHGLVESASACGVKVALHGTRAGQYWTMPPYVSGISRAEPGRYGLHQTGEIVENPDLVVSWTIAKQQADQDTKPSA